MPRNKNFKSNSVAATVRDDIDRFLNTMDHEHITIKIPFIGEWFHPVSLNVLDSMGYVVRGISIIWIPVKDVPMIIEMLEVVSDDRGY